MQLLPAEQRLIEFANYLASLWGCSPAEAGQVIRLTYHVKAGSETPGAGATLVDSDKLAAARAMVEGIEGWPLKWSDAQDAGAAVVGDVATATALLGCARYHGLLTRTGSVWHPRGMVVAAEVAAKRPGRPGVDHTAMFEKANILWPATWSEIVRKLAESGGVSVNTARQRFSLAGPKHCERLDSGKFIYVHGREEMPCRSLGVPVGRAAAWLASGVADEVERDGENWLVPSEEWRNL